MAKECCGPTEPSTPKEISAQSNPEAIFTTFRVAGMDCADEISAIKKALANPGFLGMQANLMASTVRVEHLRSFGADEIRTLIESTGVRVSASKEEEEKVGTGRIYLVAASGVAAGAGLALEHFSFPAYLVAAVCALSIASGGWLVFPKAIRAVRQLSLDMNVLMTVAVFGAVGIQQWVEAASVVFLFSLSELLEALSVARARRAIGEVLDLSPKTATKIGPEGHVSIRTDELRRGDLILVKAGDRIPVDGEVQSGASYVNQAPLTGESVPVEKGTGDRVLAGTINESSVLTIRVESAFEDSKLSQIVRLVAEAQQQKAPSERFVDAFAKVYTPAVFVLSIGTLLLPPLLLGGEWSAWFYKALVLLVVACPCALVISTPVSIVSALTAMARKGVLVKGGAFLEALGNVKAIALDKTGTITEGKPTVQKVEFLHDRSSQEVLQIAASVEKLSSHPLAEAIVRYAEREKISVKTATDFRNIVGKGAEAKIDGHEYFLGNHKYAHELGVCTPRLEEILEGFEREALSVVVVGHRPHAACAGEVLGVIAIGDIVRKESSLAIQALKAAGIGKVVMLSGDNQKTASAIARSAGIDEAFGDLLPEDKVQRVKTLVSEYGTVAMVGDGINDAPALAQASVGIAMGKAGTDTAIETADVALMHDDLIQVAKAIEMGRRARSVIKFNIGFAIALKATFIVLTFLGISNLWLAVGADTGASILVVLNSLRLLK